MHNEIPFKMALEDARLYALRLQEWSEKIAKKIDKVNMLVKTVDVARYTYSIMMCLFVYPENFEKETIKKVGYWIMDLIGSKEKPKSVTLNKDVKELPAYEFRTNVSDSFGSYTLYVNLISGVNDGKETG